MQPFRIKITIPTDGEMVLKNIPFSAGETVEVTIDHLPTEEIDPAKGTSHTRLSDHVDPPVISNHNEDDPMDREIDAYEKMHPELTKKFLGQYVAIYDGQVIDVDNDRWELLARVDDNYPEEIVLIRKVEEELPAPIYIRSPRFSTV